LKVPADVREALTALMAEYAMAIDDNRLEDWVELFDEACDYKVVMRENVEQDLPNVLMWCDNKNMLRDRIESYRQVNLYNLHYDRHVLAPLQRRPLPPRGVSQRRCRTPEIRGGHCRHRPHSFAPRDAYLAVNPICGRYEWPVSAKSGHLPNRRAMDFIADPLGR
jgi:hypothetical protein